MKTRVKGEYKIKGTVRLYPGESANWYFFTIPKKESVEIKEQHGPLAKGWNSLPVSVTLGKTTWKTSIFPDSKSGIYMVPLKAQVRKKEEIYEDDVVVLSFKIMV